MDYKLIKTEKSGPAFVITLNRPDKRNAISTHVMDELMAAAAEAEDDSNMRGIIVTGGDAFFSACCAREFDSSIAPCTSASARFRDASDTDTFLPLPV